VIYSDIVLKRKTFAFHGKQNLETYASLSINVLAFFKKIFIKNILLAFLDFITSL